MKLLIKGARLLDPENNLDKELDILIEKGRIKKLAKGIKDQKAKKIKAKGYLAAPALIDMHTHLRQPGEEDKETIYTGSLAAIAGGFGRIVCMANTKPPLDSEQDMDFIYTQAKRNNLIDVLPVAAITLGMKQQDLTEIASLKKAGAVALSEDGYTITDSNLMRRALEYARMCGLVVICHSEDAALSRGGVMNEGYMSTVLGLKGIPTAAESAAVARDINLARLSGAPIHIAHVSTKESVEVIRQAKKDKLPVTAETCPHYFTLSEDALSEYDTNLKVNPPLRTKDDVEAIKEALKEGVIDVIASDHAPHLESEKELEFDKAPFGMIGLETSLAVSLKLVRDKVIGLKELILKMTARPADILGLEKTGLAQGDMASVVIIDPDKEWQLKKENILSKSSNSGFLNQKLKGKALYLISKGRLLMAEGKLTIKEAA